MKICLCFKKENLGNHNGNENIWQNHRKACHTAPWVLLNKGRSWGIMVNRATAYYIIHTGYTDKRIIFFLPDVKSINHYKYKNICTLRSSLMACFLAFFSSAFSPGGLIVLALGCDSLLSCCSCWSVRPCSAGQSMDTSDCLLNFLLCI